MSKVDLITGKLQASLSPIYLDVENESYKHNVPKGAETHFKVTLVSEAFEGLGAVDRHRRIHAVLADELKRGVHALTLRLLTPAQWETAQAEAFKSPPCLGGSEEDKAYREAMARENPNA